jgi:hypothetical protein
MDLVAASSGNPHFEYAESSGEQVMPAAFPDMEEASPLLGAFWAWCTLSVCDPIIKTGKLFTKKGLPNHFKCVSPPIRFGVLCLLKSHQIF